MAREGIHPETPRVPYTPGWDLVGVVDRIGTGVAGFEPGQVVAAMPIHGAAGGWLLSGRKRIIPYSIQTLKRLKPSLFRQDLVALLDFLQQGKIKPLVAERLPLIEARHAQELIEGGGVTGKIVLVHNERLSESGTV